MTERLNEKCNSLPFIKKFNMPPHGQPSVYDAAYRCARLSVCCRLTRSGNAASGTGSENESGNGTVCSERERASGGCETWSGTWSGRGIWRRPCPLRRSSSPVCDCKTWSGSWSACGSGSWSGCASGSSCGSGSGSCCDFCYPQRSSACVHSILSHQVWRWRSSYRCGMQTQPPLHFCWACERPQR